MRFLFYLSLAVILYTYIGYPLLLMFLAVLMPKPVRKADVTPSVTILLSAYNEDKTIEAKINNLLGLDYPREKTEIIIGSDGSTDETYKIIKRFSDTNQIRYAVSFLRCGKPAMLNKIAKEARGDVFVFADARQQFEPGAVRELVKPFADEDVGAVSGELLIRDKDRGAGKGIGLYWQYEKTLRRLESAIGSMLGATGAVYAVRKECFIHLPENVLLDDVFIPMNAIMMKKRVVFEPAAKAYDTVSETTVKEFSRKVRTLVGNFQIFSLFPEAFNPFRSRIAFQLFSHKFLRLLVPYFLFLLVIANIFLLKQSVWYGLALFLQFIFYSLAGLGYLTESVSEGVSGILRALYIPYEFCALNWAAVAALFAYLSGGKDVRWEK